MAGTQDRTTRTMAELLPNLPRGPLSPQQQMEAVRRAQAQAEQRVALGMQLFKAAEARVAHQKDLLDEVKQEHGRLRDSLTSDITKTLHQYDQWIGGIDENFTGAMRRLEGRMATLESRFDEEREKLAEMVERTEALLAQAQELLGEESNHKPVLRRLQSGEGPEKAA